MEDTETHESGEEEKTNVDSMVETEAKDPKSDEFDAKMRLLTRFEAIAERVEKLADKFEALSDSLAGAPKSKPAKSKPKTKIKAKPKRR